MDYFAHPVQKVKADQALLSHLSHNWNWCTLVIVPFNDFQKIDSQNLKDCNEMLSMRTMMQEAVQKLDIVAIISSDVLELLWLLCIVSL